MLISAQDPSSPEAAALIDALSTALAAITGDSGRSSFDPDDLRGPRSMFAVAHGADGVATGCGAFRPLNEDLAETSESMWGGRRQSA